MFVFKLQDDRNAPVKTGGPITDADIIKLRPCEKKQVRWSYVQWHFTVHSEILKNYWSFYYESKSNSCLFLTSGGFQRQTLSGSSYHGTLTSSLLCVGNEMSRALVKADSLSLSLVFSVSVGICRSVAYVNVSERTSRVVKWPCVRIFCRVRRLNGLFSRDITLKICSVFRYTTRWCWFNKRCQNDSHGPHACCVVLCLLQLEGCFPDSMSRCAELLNQSIDVDFVDINSGCPIDLVYKKVNVLTL